MKEIAKIIIGVAGGLLLYQFFSLLMITIIDKQSSTTPQREKAATTQTNTQTPPTKKTSDSECADSNAGTAQLICGDKRLSRMDDKLERLYALALKRTNSPQNLQEEQEKWRQNHNGCITKFCLARSYNERLMALNNLVTGHKVCSIDGYPIITYRHAWTSAIADREPTDYLVQLGPGLENVTYFSEILGGRNTQIVHQWYKNGKQVAEIPFKLGGNRWRVWSTKQIDDHSAKWEIRIVSQSGCELVHETLQTGTHTATRPYSIGGWHRPAFAINELIANKDERALSLIDAIRHTSDEQSFLTDRNRWGDTPLLLAIRVGNVEAAAKLLDAGASPYVWDADETTALQLARSLRHSKIEDLLSKAIDRKIPPWGVPYSLLSENRDKPSSASFDAVTDFNSPIYCITNTHDLKGHTVRHEWGTGFGENRQIHHTQSMKIDSDIEDAVSEYKPPAGHEIWHVKVYIDDKEYDDRSFWTDNKQNKSQGTHGSKIYNLFGHTLERLGTAWAPVEKIAYFYEKNLTNMDYQYDKFIYLAVSSGNISLLKYLASQGESFENMYKRKGLLFHALEHRRYDILVYLLSLGLDINAPEPGYHRSLLHVAARNNDVTALRILLDWNADMETTNQNGMTPLHDAAHSCAKEAMGYLLKSGASPNRLDQSKSTPTELYIGQQCGSQSDVDKLFTQTEEWLHPGIE